MQDIDYNNHVNHPVYIQWALETAPEAILRTMAPVSIEVAGSRTELGRYLDGMARLPHFWLVKHLSVKAVDTQDARSPIRASIAAQAYFPN